MPGLLKKALRDRMAVVDKPDNEGPPPKVEEQNTDKKWSQADFLYGRDKDKPKRK